MQCFKWWHDLLVAYIPVLIWWYMLLPWMRYDDMNASALGFMSYHARCMLGWFDMYARWMIGDAMPDVW